MIDRPRTLEEARRIRYGTWAGKPKGTPYREGFCAESVWPGGGAWVARQCSRKNGHGPEGLYCRQHAKQFDG